MCRNFTKEVWKIRDVEEKKDLQEVRRRDFSKIFDVEEKKDVQEIREEIWKITNVQKNNVYEVRKED